MTIRNILNSTNWSQITSSLKKQASQTIVADTRTLDRPALKARLFLIRRWPQLHLAQPQAASRWNSNTCFCGNLNDQDSTSPQALRLKLKPLWLCSFTFIAIFSPSLLGHLKLWWKLSLSLKMPGGSKGEHARSGHKHKCSIRILRTCRQFSALNCTSDHSCSSTYDLIQIDCNWTDVAVVSIKNRSMLLLLLLLPINQKRNKFDMQLLYWR